MADTTTELEVLDQIVDVLGGQSGQYETVVPVLQQIKELLAAGITDPEAIAEAVTAWLDEHPEATTTVRDGSITVMKLAQDVVELLDNKADIDGYYSQLTAGLAENLIGRGDAVPAEYLYRTAGGTADIEDGIATIDCIKGNAVVWNQLIQLRADVPQVVGVTITTDPTTGLISLYGTATSSGGRNVYLATNIPLTSGHKYLLHDTINYASGNVVQWNFSEDSGSHANIIAMTGNQITTYSGDTKSCWIGKNFLADGFYDCSGYIALFDLTQMFGSGNEPATVAEFEAMFPLPYYPYSAPKMLPVDIRGVETIGFNLWDEEWELGTIDDSTGVNTPNSYLIRSKNYIIAFPNTEYYARLSGYNAHFFCYGADYAYLGYVDRQGDGEFTTLANTKFMRFRMDTDYGTTYNNDICINLSWSGYRNGEYEKHWSEERHIDTSRFFPTGLKKAGDKADALYADHYDTVIGAVDLGTLTWAMSTSGDVTFFYAQVNDKRIGITAGQPNVLACAKYAPTSTTTSVTYLQNGQMTEGYSSASSYVYIVDTAYTTAAAFKAAMSGVILYYELATLTTTPIDPPLNLSYKVSDFGTERIMVDETADAPQTAPVPMDVEYGINAIDTIRRLPTEYQSHKSMGQLTAALESSLGIDITETWDEDDQRYEYEISDFEIADNAVTPNSLSDEVLHGQYPSLSVGRADALTGADSTAQWVTRESTGSGAATVRSVQGAVVAFNQYANLDEQTKEVANDGAWTILTWFGLFTDVLVDNHVYYASFEGKGTVHSIRLGLNTGNSNNNSVCLISNPTLEYARASGVITFHAAQTGNNLIISNSPTVTQDVAGDYFTVRNIMLIDLTLMFGSGNEPSTAAEFEAMYPEAYYPYSAPTLKPVQIAGIRSTTAQGGELDSVEWTAQTLWGAGTACDVLYADHIERRIGVVDLGADDTLRWGNNGTDSVYAGGLLANYNNNNIVCESLTTVDKSISGPDMPDDSVKLTSGGLIIIKKSGITVSNAKTMLSGVLLYYELATPTTTPISPALPMTYKVQAGGSESIIVPEGEVSAAPVLTVAEGESAAELVMDALACIATPDGPTATANHAINTYLTMGGKLYKVTTAIAAGETIVAGTNVTQTTVMDELIALTQ